MNRRETLKLMLGASAREPRPALAAGRRHWPQQKRAVHPAAARLPL